jgi:hypothetical protein
MAATRPELAATCSNLRGMLMRFELGNFKHALSEENDASIP